VQSEATLASEFATKLTEARSQKSVLPNLSPLEFAAMGKERFEQLAAILSELFATFQELNQHWLDRYSLDPPASQFLTDHCGLRDRLPL
jgi:hypothetical protein